MYSIKGMIGSIFMRLCSCFPLENKIVFSCFDGKTFGDNPKAIFDEMVKEKIDYEFVWLMNDKSFKIENAKVVKANSFSALFQLCTSRVWIDNSRKREWVYKRKGQYYIQTWHAGMSMKLVEKDAIDKLPNDYIRCAIHDSKIADLFLSSSAWHTKNYRDAFWYNGRILECGLPRCDVLFKPSLDSIKKVNDCYGIASSIKIALYCPTFRNNEKLDCYKINYRELLKSLKSKWGGEWKIIVRLHPNIQISQNLIEYDDDILNGSRYPDINELIIRSDLLISDYSSCMFEAMLIDKKVIVYATDVEDYLKERGLYFDFDKLPFPFSDSNEKLVECISKFDEENYLKMINKFKTDYDVYDNGTACETVISEIRKMVAQ